MRGIFNLFREKKHINESLLANLANILAHWHIYNFQVKEMPGGSSSSVKFLIENDDGKYVLRGVNTDSDYLKFQIFIINQLAEKNFDYDLPKPLKSGDMYLIEYENYLWLLYKFIEGRPLGIISNSKQAREIGKLVAKYHEIAETINLQNYQDCAPSSLFNRLNQQNICDTFYQNANFIKTSKSQSFLEKLFIKNVDLILEALSNIPDRDMKSVSDLPKIPSYRDWHGYNILVRANQVSGLIDFDSLVESPRLKDFQCALICVASSKKGIEFNKMKTFIQSYFSVLPIDQPELMFTYSVAIDRLANFIAELLIDRRINKNLSKDQNIISAILTINWLIKNKEEFNNNLYLFSEI